MALPSPQVRSSAVLLMLIFNLNESQSKNLDCREIRAERLSTGLWLYTISLVIQYNTYPLIITTVAVMFTGITDWKNLKHVILGGFSHVPTWFFANYWGWRNIQQLPSKFQLKFGLGRPEMSASLHWSPVSTLIFLMATPSSAGVPPDGFLRKNHIPHDTGWSVGGHESVMRNPNNQPLFSQSTISRFDNQLWFSPGFANLKHHVGSEHISGPSLLFPQKLSAHIELVVVVMDEIRCRLTGAFVVQELLRIGLQHCKLSITNLVRHASHTLLWFLFFHDWLFKQ